MRDPGIGRCGAGKRDMDFLPEGVICRKVVCQEKREILRRDSALPDRGVWFSGLSCRKYRLHFLRNARGAHVRGTAENKGKAQQVVDLVGIVGTDGGDNAVRPCRFGDFRAGSEGLAAIKSALICIEMMKERENP